MWRPVLKKDLPSIQIDQADSVSASVNYRVDDAVALAGAILEAAGIGPLTRPRPRYRKTSPIARSWTTPLARHGRHTPWPDGRPAAGAW